MTKNRSGRRVALWACAAFAGTVLLAGSAAALTSAQQSAIRQYCRDDFMSHCSGVTPGGKDALVCLQHHVAGLSAGCKKAVSATMPGAAPATRAATAPTAIKPAAAPPSEGKFVPGGMLITKACARYVLMHCRGMGLDMSRKVACLVNYANSGHFVGLRCKLALKATGHLH